MGRSEKFFWDSSCPGLGVRALASGKRTWIFQYRDEHGRTRRLKLGSVSAIDLDEARVTARRKAANVAQGGNPSLDRRNQRAAGTVLEVIDAYLPYAESRQRSRTYAETKRHLRQHAKPIHHERIEAATRRDISALLERIKERSGPYAANRVRASLHAMWVWGLKTGRIETDRNPVTHTIRNPERTRERVLSNGELRRIWAATNDDSDYSRIVRLCLLTGCRREEMGSLRWNEIHGDRIILHRNRMKGGTTHEIALLPMISTTLPFRPTPPREFAFGADDTGFSGWSKCKTALDRRLDNTGDKLVPWSLHDLRRTFSTRLHDDGIAPMTIEALLAHKQQGVAAVYNRASFWSAKRAALTRWHEMLTDILSRHAGVPS
jgi:integrase